MYVHDIGIEPKIRSSPASANIATTTARRMPVVMGLGAAVAAVQGTFHLMGGRIDSFSQEADEFERKEKIRRSTRLSIEQTVAEIGEGRGTYPLTDTNCG